MAASQYLANQIINWVRGTAMPTAPAIIYVSLHDSGGTELTGNGYARIPIDAFDAAVVGAGEVSVANSEAETTPTATGNWVQATQYRLNDAITAGNALSSLTALTTPRTVTTDGSAQFAAGAFVFSMPTTTASEYLATQACEWISGTDFPAAPATCYVGWHVAGGAEHSGDGYARGAITWGANDDTGTVVRCRNTAAVSSGVATIDWPTTPSCAAYDALTTGNALSAVLANGMASAITAGGNAVIAVNGVSCSVPYAA